MKKILTVLSFALILSQAVPAQASPSTIPDGLIQRREQVWGNKYECLKSFSEYLNKVSVAFQTEVDYTNARGIVQGWDGSMNSHAMVSNYDGTRQMIPSVIEKMRRECGKNSNARQIIQMHLGIDPLQVKYAE